ncbi:MAG: hypothetical protein KAI50_00090 [Desulfobacterales bacterium]|nr:hypothetical protein [Desulfobacterales bacterium]
MEVSLNSVAVTTVETTKAPRIRKGFLKILKGSTVPGKKYDKVESTKKPEIKPELIYSCYL